MGDEPKKWDPSTPRWVILINKAPKGPLSYGQVKALVVEGVVRVNDLAFEVDTSQSPPQQPSWKFLWQFPEFDRRRPREENEEPVPQPLVPAPEKRPDFPVVRKQMSEEEIRQRIAEALPAELLNLHPEELLPSVKKPVRPPVEEEVNFVDKIENAIDEMRPAYNRRSGIPGWLYATAGFVIIGGLATWAVNHYRHSGTQSEVKREDFPAQTAPRQISAERTLPVHRPPPPRPSAPQPRELSRDERYQRRLDEPARLDSDDQSEDPGFVPETEKSTPNRDVNANSQDESAGQSGGEPNIERGPDGDPVEPHNKAASQPPTPPEEEDEETKQARDNFLGP